MYRGVIERYRALLPVSETTPVVTLYEGNTPLIPLPRLAGAISPFLTLYAKLEGLNPNSDRTWIERPGHRSHPGSPCAHRDTGHA